MDSENELLDKPKESKTLTKRSKILFLGPNAMDTCSLSDSGPSSGVLNKNDIKKYEKMLEKGLSAGKNKGRPKGSKNKPKITTIEDDADFDASYSETLSSKRQSTTKRKGRPKKSTGVEFDSDDEYFARLEEEIAREELENQKAREKKRLQTAVKQGISHSIFRGRGRGKGRPPAELYKGLDHISDHVTKKIMPGKSKNSNEGSEMEFDNDTINDGIEQDPDLMPIKEDFDIPLPPPPDQFNQLIDEGPVASLDPEQIDDELSINAKLFKMDPIKLRRRAPPLKLPESSCDINCPSEYLLDILALYEIFRCYHRILRISPVRFEDFSSALLSPDDSCLLSEIHITLIKALLREDEANGTLLTISDSRETWNLAFYFLDRMTWPYLLDLYLTSIKRSEKAAKVAALATQQSMTMMSQTNPSGSNIAGGADKYFSCTVFPDQVIPLDPQYPRVHISKRIAVLQGLVNLFMSTGPVRAEIMRCAIQPHEDFCRICHLSGELLCCDRCTAVFHLKCFNPPIKEVPASSWLCPVCEKHNQPGIDFIPATEKIQYSARPKSLGSDRAGRIYYHMARRIIVEVVDFSQREPELRGIQPGIRDDWEELCLQNAVNRREGVAQSDPVKTLTDDEEEDEFEDAEHVSMCSTSCTDSDLSCDDTPATDSYLNRKKFYKHRCNPPIAYCDEPKVYYYSTITEVQRLRQLLSPKWEPILCYRLDKLLTTVLPLDLSMNETLTKTGFEDFMKTLQERKNEETFISWPVLFYSSCEHQINIKKRSAVCARDDLISNFDLPPIDPIVVDENENSHKSLKKERSLKPLSGDSIDLDKHEEEVVDEEEEKHTGLTQNKENLIISSINIDQDLVFAKCITASTSQKKRHSVLSEIELETFKTNCNIPNSDCSLISLIKGYTSNIKAIPYRLGDEGDWKTWVNYYSYEHGILYPPNQKDDIQINISLSKSQHIEERERRKSLINKFSIAEPFTINNWEWFHAVTDQSGNIWDLRAFNFGPLDTEQLVKTIKLTLSFLEQNIPFGSLCPAWMKKRKEWFNRLCKASTAPELAESLLIFESVIRPVNFHRAWTSSLGNITIDRNTSSQRDEDKRIRFLDRASNLVSGFIDPEALTRAIKVARMQPPGSLVATKNPKPIKHTIWKLRGEEYRRIGGDGWSWISSTRPSLNESLLAVMSKKPKPADPDIYAENEGIQHGIGWREIPEYLKNERPIKIKDDSGDLAIHEVHPLTCIPLYQCKQRISYRLDPSTVYIPQLDNDEFPDKEINENQERHWQRVINISRGLKYGIHYRKFNRHKVSDQDLVNMSQAMRRRLNFDFDKLLNASLELCKMDAIKVLDCRKKLQQFEEEKELLDAEKDILLQQIADLQSQANELTATKARAVKLKQEALAAAKLKAEEERDAEYKRLLEEARAKDKESASGPASSKLVSLPTPNIPSFRPIVRSVIVPQGQVVRPRMPIPTVLRSLPPNAVLSAAPRGLMSLSNNSRMPVTRIIRPAVIMKHKPPSESNSSADQDRDDDEYSSEEEEETFFVDYARDNEYSSDDEQISVRYEQDHDSDEDEEDDIPQLDGIFDDYSNEVDDDDDDDIDYEEEKITISRKRPARKSFTGPASAKRAHNESNKQVTFASRPLVTSLSSGIHVMPTSLAKKPDLKTVRISAPFESNRSSQIGVNGTEDLYIETDISAREKLGLDHPPGFKFSEPPIEDSPEEEEFKPVPRRPSILQRKRPPSSTSQLSAAPSTALIKMPPISTGINPRPSEASLAEKTANIASLVAAQTAAQQQKENLVSRRALEKQQQASRMSVNIPQIVQVPQGRSPFRPIRMQHTVSQPPIRIIKPPAVKFIPKPPLPEIKVDPSFDEEIERANKELEEHNVILNEAKNKLISFNDRYDAHLATIAEEQRRLAEVDRSPADFHSLNRYEWKTDALSGLQWNSIFESSKLAGSRKPHLVTCPSRLPCINPYKARGKYSLFRWHPSNLRQLVLAAGRKELRGFDSERKRLNHAIWPYPSARPNMAEVWRYTLTSQSNGVRDPIIADSNPCSRQRLACVALHLRFLWSSIRWSDIHEDPITDLIHPPEKEEFVPVIVDSSGIIFHRRNFDIGGGYVVRRVIEIEPLDRYWLRANFLFREISYKQVEHHLDIQGIAKAVKAIRGVDDPMLVKTRELLQLDQKSGVKTNFSSTSAKKRGRPTKSKATKKRSLEDGDLDSDDEDWQPTIYMNTLLEDRNRNDRRGRPRKYIKDYGSSDQSSLSETDTEDAFSSLEEEEMRRYGRRGDLRLDDELDDYIKHNPIEYLSDLDLNLAQDLRDEKYSLKGHVLVGQSEEWCSEDSLNIWEIKAFIELLFPNPDKYPGEHKSLQSGIKYASVLEFEKDFLEFPVGATDDSKKFGIQIRTLEGLVKSKIRPPISDEQISELRQTEKNFKEQFVKICNPNNIVQQMVLQKRAEKMGIDCENVTANFKAIDPELDAIAKELKVAPRRPVKKESDDDFDPSGYETGFEKVKRSTRSLPLTRQYPYSGETLDDFEKAKARSLSASIAARASALSRQRKKEKELLKNHAQAIMQNMIIRRQIYQKLAVIEAQENLAEQKSSLTKSNKSRARGRGRGKASKSTRLTDEPGLPRDRRKSNKRPLQDFDEFEDDYSPQSASHSSLLPTAPKGRHHVSKSVIGPFGDFPPGSTPDTSPCCGEFASDYDYALGSDLILGEERYQHLKADDESYNAPEHPKPKSKKVTTTKNRTKSPTKSQKKHFKVENLKNDTENNEQLYCICRTPYDFTKEYIGCDTCEDWFHFSCLGLDPQQANSLGDTFSCPQCQMKTAEPQIQLYCLCRKPYNEDEMYIACDSCDDWYHPTCVGMSLEAASAIEGPYICIKCKNQTKSKVPGSPEITPGFTLHNLSLEGSVNEVMIVRQEVSEFLDSVMNHQMAWPFLKPYDEPKYPIEVLRTIISPMDLETIQDKFDSQDYHNVGKISEDFNLLFSNSRLAHFKDSVEDKCAENLETFVTKALKQIKERAVLRIK